MNGNAGQIFYLLSGAWAIGILVLFIMAVRLSYRIEARSPALENKTGVPQKAQIFHTVTNWKVARDPETQTMRRRMNWLLLICLTGMIAMGVAIRWVRTE